MTTENKHWIQENTLMLVSCSFVFFTILMQILHWCKINVFKVVVMLGTFALAMAFAGNDLRKLPSVCPWQASQLIQTSWLMETVNQWDT